MWTEGIFVQVTMKEYNKNNKIYTQEATRA